MMKFFTLEILKIFDLFYQKKIINFLKKEKLLNFQFFFDVGAHKGESIDFFLKNLNIKKIYSFEASPINYKYLSKNYHYYKKKYSDTDIKIENVALGSSNKRAILKQSYLSSSSTFSKINEDSSYFKKKNRLFSIGKKKDFFLNVETDMITLENFLKKKNIKNIDFLKIDTEGYEYEVLLGLKDRIRDVNLIMFEHHYDNMISKSYTFGKIHDLLNKSNFVRIFKVKMPFRKTFEYIYKRKV